MLNSHVLLDILKLNQIKVTLITLSFTESYTKKNLSLPIFITLVTLSFTESYTKKNLSLPTFVVLEPVAATSISEPASVHTNTNNNKHGEDKDENVA